MMKLNLCQSRSDCCILIFFVLYGFVNVLTLTQFPFVHSDEAWLSGLSRAMLQTRDLSATEPFFDLYPRSPHAIKTLFHLLQLPFYAIFGYSLFAARMLSLTFSLLTLYQFYRLLRHATRDSRFGREWIPFLFTVALALDIQFLYASRFARQEIILLFILITLLRIHLHLSRYPGFREVLFTSVILGLAMGVHPNSFVIALPFATYYILLSAKRLISVRLPLLLIGLLGLFASGFAGLSLWMNPGFFADYSDYGSTLGVTAKITDKLYGLIPFIQKLYLGISGTYYTPDIRIILVLFMVASVCCTALLLKGNVVNQYSPVVSLNLLTLASLLLGIMMIGRYSQPSIIFIFPSGYLLLAVLADRLPLKKSFVPLAPSMLLTGLIVLNTVFNLSDFQKPHGSYEAYLSAISRSVPENARVLANLNADYYFDGGALMDYRNLAYLKDHNLSFEDYIDSRNIQFILYTNEMDLIYNKRPLYNSMYGNTAPYYDSMIAFLSERCLLVDTIRTPYAMRIANKFPDPDSTLRIYQVMPKR